MDFTLKRLSASNREFIVTEAKSRSGVLITWNPDKTIWRTTIWKPEQQTHAEYISFGSAVKEATEYLENRLNQERFKKDAAAAALDFAEQFAKNVNKHVPNVTFIEGPWAD